MKRIPERYRYKSTGRHRTNYDFRSGFAVAVGTGDPEFVEYGSPWNYDHSDDAFYSSPDLWSIDSVGFRERDNPLLLEASNFVPPLLLYDIQHESQVIHEGTLGEQIRTSRRRFEGWHTRCNSHALTTMDSTESDIEFVTRAVAGLNPSRSDFQAMVFLAELRQLPELFEGLGRNISNGDDITALLRDGGNEHLRMNYGWAPMIRDFKKFFSVAEKLQKRMKTLNDLRGKGKIRRQFKEKDGNGTQIKHANMLIDEGHTIGLHDEHDDTIKFRAHTEMRTTRWCDVEFALDIPSNLFSPIDSARFTEVHSLVYGTTIDGPALWNAMPWSWFIDWSTNMSEYISSQANVVGASMSKVVLMKKTELYTTIYPVTDNLPAFNGPNSMTLLPGRYTTVTKERILDVEPGVVHTSEAILGDDFRSSILGALLIQKFRLPKSVRF